MIRLPSSFLKDTAEPPASRATNPVSAMVGTKVAQSTPLVLSSASAGYMRRRVCSGRFDTDMIFWVGSTSVATVMTSGSSGKLGPVGLVLVLFFCFEGMTLLRRVG